MRIRVVRFLISALASGALFSGCAGAGSSVTQSAGAVPATQQQGTLAKSSGGRAHSGARRTLAAPTCSGTGSGAFVGGPGSAMFGLNVAAGEYATVAGGENNQACDAWSIIAGGYSNAVSGSSGSPEEDGFIGGGENNVVTGSGEDSAVVGGDYNAVSANDSAIVGGVSNSVAGAYSFIGGGQSNGITSAASYAAIVSGDANTLSGEYGFIGGGEKNTVSGKAATLSGGYDSLASGAYATVPGGYANYATGTGSFAAGVESYAAAAGAFVWPMTRAAPVAWRRRSRISSSRARRVALRSGRTPARRSARSWPPDPDVASASDRNLKTDVARIDDAAVLDKVAALPISRWSYKSEHGVRHVGPMAQDFYAAFKVGEDDKHITSIDEDGVALAAIKALHAENARLRGRYTAENAALRRQLAALKAAEEEHQAHDRRVDAELASLEGRSPR